MNFDGGTVRYNIEVNTDGFDRTLDSLNDDFERLTGKFEKLEDVLDETTQKKFYKLIKEAEDLGDAFESSDKSAEQINYTLEKGNDIIEEMAQLLGETADAAEEAVEPMESLGSALARTLGDAGLTALKGLATGTAGALVSLAQKGISATNFLETSQIGMSGLLGSMEEGTKALAAAADFWQNNPFNRFDVTSATKQLVQYGRTVQQLPKDLEILGNVSLSTGIDITTLARSFGRVSASGRAMTIDLEMLSDRGVPIYRELAKALGVAQGEVKKLASQGKVDFATFKQAMESAVNPEAMNAYSETLARQRDRLSGSISMLAGELAGYKIVNNELVIASDGLYKNWVRLTNTLATGLRTTELKAGFEKIGKALGNVLDKVFQFYEVMDDLGNKVVHSKTLETAFAGIAKAVDFIGDHAALLIPIFATAFGVISRLTSQIPILGNLIGGLGNKITAPIKALVSYSPALTALVAVLSVGFAKAYKSSETFRESIKKLLSSLSTIMQKLLPIVQAFIEAFVDFASSPVVTGALELVVALLSDIVNLVSNLPTEVLAVFVGLVVGLKLSSISPWIYWGTALSLIYSWIKKIVQDAGGLKTVLNNLGTSIHNFFTGISNFLKQFSLENIGKNFIAGFVKGVLDGLRETKSAIMSGFQGLITGIKNIFGIHSPSKVMYGIGTNIGLGLAEGITDSQSVVQKAMDNLATDVLKQAQSVIGNMSDFGLIDANATYKEWKKVANLFNIGSKQYEQAIEKMEEARKNVNLEIIKLQQEYNSTLDDSIKKIQKFYGIFDEVSTKGGKNATQIIKNLDQQVAQTAEWAEAQKIINRLGLDPEFVKELQGMGVESVSELSSIANMTSSELEEMNTLWLKKQSIAEDSAIHQLSGYKTEVLNEISDLAKDIDGETVQIKEEGGRLVASIGEGVVGALPTLESSFAQLNDYLAEAAKELKSSGTASADVSSDLGDDPLGIEGLKQDIQSAFTDLKDTVSKWAPWIAGGMGLVGAFKIGSGLLQGATGTGILGNIGKLFKKNKAAEAAQGMGHVDLSGLNKTSSQLGETSKNLSKANEWLTTITKAALAIAAIAVAIAAIAGSIWVMDKALADIDWGTFLSKLGMVAVATVAMGALAFAVSKLNPGQMALGAGVIVLLALDVAAIGAAIGVANYAMEGIKWGEFMSNIGMMAVAIVAMGALAAIAGIPVVAGLVALGAAVILALAADIVVVSSAIAFMDAAIPDDLDKVRGKLGLLCEAIGAFELLTGLAGVFALFEGLGILVVLGIAKDIEEVAKAIWIMNLAIPDDLNKVQAKLDLLKSVIQQMGEANLGNVFKNVVQSARITALKPTIDAFVQIAGSLRQIEGLNVSKDDIFGIMGALEALISSGKTLESFSLLGKNAAESMAVGVLQGREAIYNAGIQIQGALWEGVQSKFADEYQQGIYLAYSLKDGILSVLGDFTTVGGQIQSNFWQGVENKKQDEYYQGRSMGEIFRQGLYDVDYANAGWWAVQGFINGANNRAYGYEGVYHTGWWVADTFLKGLRARGEQGSPWKTTMESGVFAAEGLIEGLKSMESEVVDEAEILADGIVNALDISSTTLSPELNVRGTLSPDVVSSEYGVGGRGVVVNMQNNVYTDLDMEQVERDLSYSLARI